MTVPKGATLSGGPLEEVEGKVEETKWEPGPIPQSMTEQVMIWNDLKPEALKILENTMLLNHDKEMVRGRPARIFFLMAATALGTLALGGALGLVGRWLTVLPL